MALLVKS